MDQLDILSLRGNKKKVVFYNTVKIAEIIPKIGGKITKRKHLETAKNYWFQRQLFLNLWIDKWIFISDMFPKISQTYCIEMFVNLSLSNVCQLKCLFL